MKMARVPLRSSDIVNASMSVFIEDCASSSTINSVDASVPDINDIGPRSVSIYFLVSEFWMQMKIMLTLMCQSVGLYYFEHLLIMATAISAFHVNFVFFVTLKIINL